MKISFKNDYEEGCHPRILEALLRTNFEQQDGYGQDDYSRKAADLIRDRIKSPKSKVYFVSGGTQANIVVISAFLQSYESVVSADTGHIWTNEAGAIEAAGHKVNVIGTRDGKLTPEHVKTVIENHQLKPHQVKQKMVYISNSTELGTIFTKKELKELSDFCKSNSLYLYIDGARLGSALVAENNDLTLEDVAKYTDAFYIGGTKNGALIGEAIVVNSEELQEDFEYYLKQKGALLSKGRLLGIQFLELFKDDLYFEIARHANRQAMRLKEAFEDINCDWLVQTSTNQLFPILKNSQVEHLLHKFDFYVWKKIDESHSVVRIVTSWATKEEHVELFVEEIEKLKTF